MSALTESFRLGDVYASSLSPRRAVAATYDVSPAEAMANFASAATLAMPEIELPWETPGAGLRHQLARALTRPADAVRTAEEEAAEELLNTVTHGLGLVASAIAVAYLLTFVATVGGGWRVASCMVYGLSLVAMYASSTGLHAAKLPESKLRFQLCDHVAIYLLIAGTYTPFLASLMRGFAGYGLLACVWGLAAYGISIKLRNADRLGDTSPLPCLGLGWLVLVAIKPLMAVLPLAGLGLLVAGGICYSIGMLFYCRDDKQYFHAIWHLWVIAGTAFHFIAVLLYVAC